MDGSNRSVTRRGWGTRLRGSFRGILFGILCLSISAWFLFWNEGRAVKTYRALQEGGGIVLSVDAAAVLPENEGKLIHFTGTAQTDETLVDDAFNLSVSALHLERQVEMHQWRESSKSTREKKLGGSEETVTTYSYERVWSSEPIDSGQFKSSHGHENPGYFPFPNRKFSARNVQVGAFRLPTALTSRIANWQDVAVRVDQLPYELRWKAHPYEGGVFLGRNPASPAVGDLRVRFRSTPATQVSVVARQIGSSLEPWAAANGQQIQLLRLGPASAEAMFAGAQRSNRTTTWLFRLLGFLGVFLGWRRIFKPLSVMGDVIPVLGNALEKGARTVAFLLALGTASVVIATAWLYYRPLLAALILFLALLCVLGIVRLARRAPQRSASHAPSG